MHQTKSDFKSAIDNLLFKGREVQLIQVLSKDEITPGVYGKLNLLDSEALDEDDPRNYRTEITRSAFKAYEEALVWHQNELRDFCASRSVGFFTVCSDEKIEEILFHKATEAELIK